MARKLIVAWEDEEGGQAAIGRWPAAWLILPILLLVAFAAAVAVTALVYRRASERIAQYQTMSAEVESLRRQNERLRILEAELTELRELQQQMLRLAGIEAALGVDLQMLEELREASPGDTAAVDPRLLVWPLAGPLTAEFTAEHPGVDIDAPRGQPVLSAGRGLVEETGTNRRIGRHVTVRHAEGWSTVYGNLAISIVDAGDTLALGQILGLVGLGGEGSTPHLHLEVWRDGTPVPPGEVLKPRTP